MSVDQQGLISVVGNLPFQDEYLPLLEDIRLRLSPAAFPLTHSVYVYGSVAIGRAVPGRSDLDLSLILRGQPSERDTYLIEEIRQEIEAVHPIVSKVDFDIGLLGEADMSIAWQYWLKHHCRCIVGKNLAEGVPPFRPSRTLALAVNGDFEDVLEKYGNALAVVQPEAVSGRFVREASRKLIRSTNVLRNETDPDWPETLEDHAIRFERLFPERGGDLRYFLEQAQRPNAAPASFSRRLRAFSDWMVCAVRASAELPRKS